MKYRTAKGEGGHMSRQLTAPQKAALTIWLSQRKSACESLTAIELATMASSELGFEVGESSINTHRTAVFPDLRRSRAPRNLDAINERFVAIENRVQHLAIELAAIKNAIAR